MNADSLLPGSGLENSLVDLTDDLKTLRRVLVILRMDRGMETKSAFLA
jgi:hypothetical protein